MAQLDIYYGDILVGAFGLSPQADYYVEYAGAWMQSGFSISVHIPKEQKYHEGKLVEYYVENLLPEAELRQAIARRHGVSENNYFALMQIIGRDCAGAFSLGGPQSAGQYETLSQEELRNLLHNLPRYPLAANRKGASFSLAGAQNKIPLHQNGSEYRLPLYGAASNCIIKTPMQHAECSVPNELFCMRLAAKVLSGVAGTDYLPLGPESSLVVYRYDRMMRDNQLVRLPQEDFCQLAGLPSRLKYESEGGPGFATCANLIRSYCSTPAPNLIRMLHWAIFNLCIGNMDAHAKNLSLLTIDSGKMLAPFYDLVCTLYYEGFSTELAMNIGSRSNPDKIGVEQWKKFAQEIGLPDKLVLQEAKKIILRTIDALPAIAESVSAIVPQKNFIRDLRKFILNRCILLLRKLG